MKKIIKSYDIHKGKEVSYLFTLKKGEYKKLNSLQVVWAEEYTP